MNNGDLVSIPPRIEFTSRVTLSKFYNLSQCCFLNKKGRDSNAFMSGSYKGHNNDKICGVQTVGALILSALPLRD